MKIKNGFVSNSSTSSFTIITPKKYVDPILNKMSDFEKDIINHVMTEKTFMGHRVCIIQGSSGNRDSWDNFDFDKYDIMDDLPDSGEVMDKFEEELRSKTGDIIKLKRDF